MKVEKFYNKNQFIIRGEGKTVFQSYQSEIAEIDKNGNLTLGIDWDYSRTTLKHLYLFLNNYIILLNSNLKECIEESKKCILICSNCHKELHAGLWQIEDLKLEERDS